MQQPEISIHPLIGRLRFTRFLPGFSSSTIVPVYSDFHRVRPLELRGPKALGDIRGVTYIYGMFYRFGLIDVP